MWKSERTSQHGTQTVKTHNRTKHKCKKISNTDPAKYSRGNSGVPASYKTPTLLLIYTVKSVNVLAATSENQLSLQIWIFHNVQLDCDDNSIIL